MNKKVSSKKQSKKPEFNKDNNPKSLDWYKIIPIIISCVALALSVFTFIGNKTIAKRNNYNIETERMIQAANNDFLSVSELNDYKIILEKYEEIQKRKPNDNTGCEKFLDRVEILISKGKCDDNTKVLLSYAKKLNVVKNNVRLNNFEKICNNQ